MRKKIKILTIVGARPNFIKIRPLFQQFKKYKNINPILAHTGQHYDFDMSQIFFEQLEIPKPNYNLGIGSGSHSEQIAKTMLKIEKVILKEKPDIAIVVGDVNSTLAGALTAKKIGIPVAHIEAGLRSFDKEMPEEINRILTDHISDYLFCPTKNAVLNLKKEGITKGVYDTGDIMYDAFLKSARIARKRSKIFKNLKIKPRNYLLLTIHRPSNTDKLENLKKIMETIAQSGETIIFPCHPRTRKQLKKVKIKFNNLKIIKPANYLDMINLEVNSKKIITDSGGIQKEAYWLKIPCITLRDNTEWIETVENKWNILVGNDELKIARALKNFNPISVPKKYFGNGETAKKILKILLKKIPIIKSHN